MKVLHVYKTYLPDDFTGIPRVIHSIAEGTAGLGVENRVFALTTRADETPFTVGSHVVHPIRRDLQIASTDLALGAFNAFRRMAKEADLVHYHFPWPFGDLLWLHAGRAKPSVVTYHSDIVKQQTLLKLYAPLRDFFLSKADAIVATSPNYATSSAVLSKFANRVDVIPIGIESRPSVEAAVRDRWERQLGSAFFLFVGAARYYKGVQYLIEAAKISGLPVVFAGDAGDLQDRSLPANIKVLGRISDEDKEAILDLCRAFVFPSHMRSEAFGVALLEAARAGKPMISCEIGTGTTYVNAAGQTGIVVPPESGEFIARAMQAITADADLAYCFGIEARKRYETLFTQQSMAEAYAGLYRRVLFRRSKLK